MTRKRLTLAVRYVLVLLAGCAPMHAPHHRARRPRHSATVTRRAKGPSTRDLLAAVREAIALAKVAKPTPEQRQREAELNALFERDMRRRDGLRPEWGTDTTGGNE